MDRSKAKAAGRRKLIRDKADTLKEKTPRKAPASAVMKQAGRYRAIETARKHLSEAQQAVVPDQDQEPYTAVDKVEAYAVNTAHELIPTHYHSPHVQRENVSHGETHFRDPQQAKAPTPQYRMRRQMVQEIKRQRAEASRELSRNLSHGETSFADDSQLPETPQEELCKSYLQSGKHQKNASININGHAGNDLPPGQNTEALTHQSQRSKGARPIRDGADRKKQITGQRQRALSRDASSAGASKTQIAKEQGRRYARDQAIKEIKSESVKGAAKAGSDIVQKIGAVITKAVRPSSDDLMLYGGFALVLIIPLIMLAGIAVALFGTGEGRSSYVPVSAEVEAYTPLIQLYANEYGIPEYTELIKAVMMQESGGQGTDPMQCSESGFNTRYPHAPNSITDPEYSIDVGVHTLADVLSMAAVESPIDLEHISLALQGYNYGPGYISWALANYGGYSELNAIEFSDMMAAQYGWAGYGDKAYVSHVLRYYPVGRAFMGEGNAAMVAVAQSQIGKVGGAPYWNWWGLDYRVEWCAIFVSWCADQCGYIDAGVAPKFAYCPDGVNWFMANGQWQDRDYTPASGDIIFFDRENDGIADHVGIVEYVENDMIYTVEGNVGESCAQEKYSIGAAEILGYGKN